MAWLAWGLLGLAVGIIFKFVAQRPGIEGLVAGICVGVAGGETGGWIAGYVWGQGVIGAGTANLAGAVVGAIALLAFYWYRLKHHRPGNQYVNPNAM